MQRDDVFELELDGEGFSGDEVAFRSPMPPARRKALIGAGIVVVVVLGLVVSRLGGDGGPEAAPTTTADTTTADTTAERASGTSTIARPNGATGVYVPAAPFVADPGYRVYLFSVNGSESSTSVDLTNGEQTSLASSRPFVAATDAGPRFLDWNEVAAPDGTIWSVDRDSLVASSVTGDDRAETGRFPLSTAFVRSDIIGVDGAGRPVLRGPDLGGYVVDADGRSERIVEGIVLSVSPAAAVIVRCDDAAACELVTTAPGAVTVPVTATYGRLVYGPRPTISPDGRWLGLQDSRPATTGPRTIVTRLVDLATGTAIELDSAGVQMYLSLGALAFSPDSRFCFYVADSGLWAYELATGEVHEIVSTGMDAYAVSGVG